MDKRENSLSYLLIPILISLIAGGVLGWITGVAFSENNSSRIATSVVPGIGGGPEQNQQVNFTSESSNFRVKLNSLFKEHGVLAVEYLTGIYDGKDVAAIKEKINANSNEIATLFGNIYGEGSKNEFEQMWNGHIEQYEKYTKSLKANNSSDANEAENALRDQATHMGVMLNKQDSNFSSQRVTEMVSEHVRLTLDIVDAHVDEDYETKADNIKASYDQAGVFADYIGQVIVNSHPDKAR